MRTALPEPQYNSLFVPLTVGSLELKNRVYISAHAYGFYDSDGTPTDQMLQYVLRRAMGGAALIVLGETHVGQKQSSGGETWGESVSSDRLIPFYRRLSRAVRPFGMKVFEQIFHPGGQVWPEAGAIAYAPSPIPHAISSLVPAEMDHTMIQETVMEFASAARRAMYGGLDGVEVKLDQGKLLHQFLSPYFNRRTDEYGGDFNSRMKLVIEVLAAIRSSVQRKLVVGVRLAGDTLATPEFKPVDLLLEDTLQISRALEATGLIDYISLSGATNSNLYGYWQSHGDSTVPRANFRHISRELKTAVSLPIFLASQILEPLDATSVISTGDADMVAMTRAHIADPDIMRKVQNSDIAGIRPCISCNQNCVGNTWVGRPLSCIHNPEAGHEAELRPTVALHSVSRRKKVAIIGAGPAGLEAARVAGARGHEVFLYERQRAVGGQILVAARSAHRQRLAEITTFLESQILRLPNVSLMLNHEATVTEIIDHQAAQVIIATGSDSVLPPIIAGEASRIASVEDVLQDCPYRAGETIVMVDEDWRMHALSVADLLTDRGIRVVIVTSHAYAGEGLDIVSLTSYHTRLDSKGLTSTVPWTQVIAVEGETVILRSILSNKQHSLTGIRAVVVATNRQPAAFLSSDFEAAGMKTVRIGDCVFPRGVDTAIYEGHKAGLAVQ